MYKHIAFILSSTFCFALGLSAQENGPAQTIFTFSEEQSALQQLMKISESNPHVMELFFLEEQPPIPNGRMHIGTATGPNSFAYGNFTAAEMYAQILQVPTNEIYAEKNLKDKRYNLFYHSGGQTMDEELRHQIAHQFLERIDVKVSEEDSVIMDRMVFTATEDIEKSIAQVDELGTASIHRNPFKISMINQPVSKVLSELQKKNLFNDYQFIDQTGLSEEQTLDLKLKVRSIDALIASAAEQGLEITVQEGKGRKVMLTPQ